MIGQTLLEIMRETSKPKESETTDLLFGEVTSIDPLKIKIDGRFEVDEKFIILSCLVKETIIRVPRRPEGQFMHKHPIPSHYTNSADGHSHTIPPWETNLDNPDILLWRGLRVGDIVRIIRVNNGQKFYVIELDKGIPYDDS